MSFWQTNPKNSGFLPPVSTIDFNNIKKYFNIIKISLALIKLKCILIMLKLIRRFGL